MWAFLQGSADKSLSLKEESCHSGKVSKDRITALLYCNEDGLDMITPWVVRKWKQPTCLKNTARLPCVYKQNTKAWMTCSFYKVFLHYLKGGLGRNDCKRLLFLNNCSAHPKVQPFLQKSSCQLCPNVLKAASENLTSKIKFHSFLEANVPRSMFGTFSTPNSFFDYFKAHEHLF